MVKISSAQKLSERISMKLFKYNHIVAGHYNTSLLTHHAAQWVGFRLHSCKSGSVWVIQLPKNSLAKWKIPCWKQRPHWKIKYMLSGMCRILQQKTRNCNMWYKFYFNGRLTYWADYLLRFTQDKDYTEFCLPVSSGFHSYQSAKCSSWN